MALAVAAAAGLPLSLGVVFDTIGRSRRTRRLVRTGGLPQEANFAALFGVIAPAYGSIREEGHLELLEQQRRSTANQWKIPDPETLWTAGSLSAAIARK